MLKPTIVLAPIDFSAPSLDAAGTAAEIATRFKATLVLAHVVPALPKIPASVSFFKEGEYEQRLHAEATARIKDLAAKYAHPGLTVQTEIGIANDVPMELLRIGERLGADLVVIATHGMTGWNERIFGSVAEKVVRLSSAAVLVLKAPAGTTSH